MVQVRLPKISLEEFLQLPATKPESEYIDGQIIQKPVPQGKHSRLQGKLVSTIENLATGSSIAMALPELRCTFGGRSLVPDVVVLQWERIPRDEKGEIANVFSSYPDWTIEILSPEQNSIQVTKNILHCLEYGCSLGWLIVPDERNVLVYPQGQQPHCLEQEGNILPVPDFLPPLRLTVGELFSWLKL